jgi:hypothetical protein
VPALPDLVKFKDSWKKWWVHLQPAERKAGEDFESLTRWGTKNSDWTDLARGGVNGFFSVVLTLSWWLNAVTTDKEGLLELEAIFEDVLWVQDKIIFSLRQSKVPTRATKR